MRCAVVDLGTNLIVNMIIAGEHMPDPPEGCMLVDVTETFCGIGWAYDPATGAFNEIEE